MDNLTFQLVQLSLQRVAIFLLELELLFLVCEHHSLEVSRNLHDDLGRWLISKIQTHFAGELFVDLSCAQELS